MQLNIWKYWMPIFYHDQQKYFLVFILILYILFLIFTFYKNKKIWFLKHIIIFISFIYSFFLINLSFLPILDLPEKLTFVEKINFLPFSWFESQYLEFRFLHFFVLLPAWFLINFFIKNIKKNIFIWFLFSIILEFLQLILIYFWDIFSFKIRKIFNIDDIFINFLWFIFWIILFIILNKIYKYFTENYCIFNKKDII